MPFNPARARELFRLGAQIATAAYRPLLDTLHFFDNSSDSPRLVFKDECGQTTTNDAALYNQLRQEFSL